MRPGGSGACIGDGGAAPAAAPAAAAIPCLLGGLGDLDVLFELCDDDGKFLVIGGVLFLAGLLLGENLFGLGVLVLSGVLCLECSSPGFVFVLI